MAKRGRPKKKPAAPTQADGQPKVSGKVGGKRPGAGAPKGNRNAQKTNRGRQFMRDLVDDADRRALFTKALDAELAEGKTRAFIETFEHGYGRPPQALDVNFANATSDDGEQQVFQVKIAGGDVVPSASAGISNADAAVGGTD